MEPPNFTLGLGRYGMALAFILYTIVDQADALPTHLHILTFIGIALIIILAKFLAVRYGVKDEEPPPHPPPST